MWSIKRYIIKDTLTHNDTRAMQSTEYNSPRNYPVVFSHMVLLVCIHWLSRHKFSVACFLLSVPSIHHIFFSPYFASLTRSLLLATSPIQCRTRYLSRALALCLSRSLPPNSYVPLNSCAELNQAVLLFSASRSQKITQFSARFSDNSTEFFCLTPCKKHRTVATKFTLSNDYGADFGECVPVYLPLFLTFSAQTSANQMQDNLDGKMDKRQRSMDIFLETTPKRGY